MLDIDPAKSIINKVEMNSIQMCSDCHEQGEVSQVSQENKTD